MCIQRYLQYGDSGYNRKLKKSNDDVMIYHYLMIMRPQRDFRYSTTGDRRTGSQFDRLYSRVLKDRKNRIPEEYRPSVLWATTPCSSDSSTFRRNTAGQAREQQTRAVSWFQTYLYTLKMESVCCSETFACLRTAR